jgi:hypothetical protein
VLLEPHNINRTKPCKVQVIVDSLEGQYREAVESMLVKSYVDGGLTDDEITSRLDSAGISVGATTIRKHRKSTCSCKRVTV